MKRLFFVLILFVFHAESYSVSGQQTYSGWRAGITKVMITPEESLWMGGYGARNKPAGGKLNDLWAKMLLLEDAGGQRALLITTDLEGFPKSISDRIRDRIHDKLGLSRSQVILNSSHTHSGPVLFTESVKGMYPMDSVQQNKAEVYREWLIDRIVETADKVQRSLKPVTVFAGSGVTRFQVNRRNNKESELTGQTELKGPNDYAVPVLKLTGKKGEVKAILFGYACHPTVLNGYDWSGDYPGFAQIELENEYKGSTAMFFQGAGGDQNPLPRRTIGLARQYGKELAAAVERVMEENMRELSPKLLTAYSEVSLSFDTLPSSEELIRMKEESTGYEKQWAANMLEKISKGEAIRTSYPYPVQAWSLGNQMIISLGGELCVDYSIKLKQIFGDDLFVMGYCNDYMGYILSEAEMAKGGYEAVAYRFGDLPAPWKSGTEQLILSEAAKLACQVRVRR